MYFTLGEVALESGICCLMFCHCFKHHAYITCVGCSVFVCTYTIYRSDRPGCGRHELWPTTEGAASGAAREEAGRSVSCLSLSHHSGRPQFLFSSHFNLGLAYSLQKDPQRSIQVIYTTLSYIDITSTLCMRTGVQMCPEYPVEAKR